MNKEWQAATQQGGLKKVRLSLEQGADIFIEVKGVDHAGNEAQLTENPTVGADE